MNVLLVDDEPSLLEQAKIFLRKEDGDMDLNTTTRAQEGLNKLHEDDIHAIISDYQMPGMDGLTFLELVRKRMEDIPFIMFTGKGREDVAMEALNLGADRYLRKGGDPKTQYSMLARAVKQEVEHYRRKKVQKESERMYRQIFNKLGDAVYIREMDDEGMGRILEANRIMCEMTGYSEEELLDIRPCQELSVGSPREISKGEIKEKLSRGQCVRYEQKRVDRDGNIYWVEEVATPIVYGDREAALVINRNMSKEMK